MSKELGEIRKKLDAYLKGNLSNEQVDELWVEFAKQPELLNDLEIEVGIRDIIKNEGVRKDNNMRLLKSSFTWYASAAAIVFIVFGIQFFQVPSKSNLDQFVVKSINSDELESSDGIRSRDMTVVAPDSILNLGFNEFVNGNYDQALRLFNQIIHDYDYEPYASKAYLNKGIIYYNTSNYDSAMVAFNKSISLVIDNKIIEEKAYWYLGNSLANVGNLKEARIAVLQAYSLEGVYRKPAFLLLQKLNFDLGYSEAAFVDG